MNKIEKKQGATWISGINLSTLHMRPKGFIIMKYGDQDVGFPISARTVVAFTNAACAISDKVILTYEALEEDEEKIDRDDMVHTLQQIDEELQKLAGEMSRILDMSRNVKYEKATPIPA